MPVKVLNTLEYSYNVELLLSLTQILLKKPFMLPAITLLNLQETFSLCVMYARPALCLTPRQISELNVSWNNVIKGCLDLINGSQSVLSAMLLGLCRLNIKFILLCYVQ